MPAPGKTVPAMRLRLPLLLFVLLSAASFTTAAADKLEKFLLRCYIYDKEYNSLDSVHVSITRADTSAVPFKVLRGNDEQRLATGGQLRAFIFSGLGTYRLTLSKPGYEPLQKEFSINSVSEDVKYLGTLQLEKESERTRELKEATVSATRIKMVMKGDTVVFNANAFQLSNNSMLEALIRQLPNVTIDDKGVITHNGRKAKEILVNGQDFFKGDPNVALQNLPAYTVKNIRIYDKKADDAYLTHSDARIDKREEDENLVIDVQLKKEYLKGAMGNAGAGYGTNDRFMGRAFVMGYTDKFRLTAYGNVNNIGASGRPTGDNGTWRDQSWRNSGTLTTSTGGLEYNYDDSKKVKVNGNVIATNTVSRSYTLNSHTAYFTGGDVFARSSERLRDDNFRISTGHTIRLNFPHVSLNINPSFDYSHQKRQKSNLTATFAADLTERYRGEAIDSLFTPGATPSARFASQLLTLLAERSRSGGNNLNTGVNINGSIRPTNWKGILYFDASANYSDFSSKSRNWQAQDFGSASGGGAPVNRDKWTPNDGHDKNAAAGLRYSRDYRHLGDVKTSTFNYTVAADYSYNQSDQLLSLFLGADPVTLDAMLPALIAPTGALQDLANSSDMSYFRHRATAGVTVSYSFEPTSPSDNGANSSMRFSLTARNKLTREGLDYCKPSYTPQRQRRTTSLPGGSASMHYSSANKRRNITAVLSYSLTSSAPNLNNYVTDPANEDPLFIELPATHLHTEAIHYVNCGFSYYSRGKRPNSFSVFTQLHKVQNSVEDVDFYNKDTGVTTSQPRNINGSWYINIPFYATIYALPDNRLELDISLPYTYTRSVGYTTLGTEPERSEVNTTDIVPNVKATLRVGKGTYLSLWPGYTYKHATSRRPGFTTVNTADYSCEAAVRTDLPWQMKFETSLNLRRRTRYADATMNGNEWTWNASLEKSILSGNLTFRLQAVDILKSVKPTSVYIYSSGRSETWRQATPQYVMLTVNYRLNMKKPR